MITTTKNAPSTWLVILAFATVYIVWGSTYFFIQMAIHGIPAMIMGAMRYISAGLLVLAWCAYKGDKIWVKRDVINSAITGLILLGIGNGIVIWVEQALPSAMVAIMVSANPIWFVILDKRNWRQNLTSTATVVGLIIGLAGVILLFGEQVANALGGPQDSAKIWGVALLVIGPIGWSAGSLYSKYNGNTSPARVNTGWQMLIAGIAFLPAAGLHNEFSKFDISQVPLSAWLAVGYLIVFGSIAAFTAYVWLLQVRPAAQVSTHSYVNPVIAVLLGVLFAQEHISWLQIGGLVIILLSVLLINLAKYRKTAHDKKEAEAKPVNVSGKMCEVA